MYVINNERTDDNMNETIRQQIITIRDTGRTNMFDINTVQRIAFEYDFYELVEYIENNTKKYLRFILTGKTE